MFWSHRGLKYWARTWIQAAWLTSQKNRLGGCRKTQNGRRVFQAAWIGRREGGPGRDAHGETFQGRKRSTHAHTVLGADSLQKLQFWSHQTWTCGVTLQAHCLMLSHRGSLMACREEAFSSPPHPVQTHCLLLTQDLFCAKAANYEEDRKHVICFNMPR